jgi:hypothetical protein
MSIGKKPWASRLRECGELQREVINKNKKNTCIYPTTCAAKGLCHAVQSLQPSLSLDHGRALEGEDGHLHKEEGSRMEEQGELLREIANEKKKIPI